MRLTEAGSRNSSSAVASQRAPVGGVNAVLVHQDERGELRRLAGPHEDVAALSLRDCAVAVEEADEVLRPSPSLGDGMMLQQSGRPFLRCFMIIHVGIVCVVDDVARLSPVHREPHNVPDIDAEPAQCLGHEFDAVTFCHVLKIRWKQDGRQHSSYIIIRTGTR